MIKHFVSDHASIRFQERVCFLEPNVIENILNNEINRRPPAYFVNWDKQLDECYIGKYGNKEFYIIVGYDEQKNRHYVKTVLDINCKIQIRYYTRRYKSGRLESNR